MGPGLDSTDALVRDTYVHFAVAMFWAQNLETEIVNAMIIARLPEKRPRHDAGNRRFQGPAVHLHAR